LKIDRGLGRRNQQNGDCFLVDWEGKEQLGKMEAEPSLEESRGQSLQRWFEG